MKITLVTTGRLTDAKGGTEKVLCDMANSLYQRGHEVTIISFDPKAGSPGFHLDSKIAHLRVGAQKLPYGMKLICKLQSIDWRGEIARKKRFESKAKIFRYQMKQFINQVPTDIYVSYQLQTTFALRPLIDSKKPIVSMIHGAPEDVFKPSVVSSMKKVLSSADVIQVLMPEYKRKTEMLFPSQTVVSIPNVVPQYCEIANHQNKKIIHVGRISPEKRQHLFIQAFSQIKNEFPEWKVELWGEDFCHPSYTSQIKQLIASSDLTDTVSLMGTTNVVAEKLKACSVFVFPSSLNFS